MLFWPILFLLSLSLASSYQTEEIAGVRKKVRSIISNPVQVADPVKPQQLVRKATKARESTTGHNLLQNLPLDRDLKMAIQEKFVRIILRMYFKAFACQVLQILALKFMDPESWSPSVSLIFPPLLDIMAFIIPFLWDEDLWKLDFPFRMLLTLMHMDSSIYHFAVADIHSEHSSAAEFAIFSVVDAAMSLGINDLLAKRLKDIKNGRKFIK